MRFSPCHDHGHLLNPEFPFDQAYDTATECGECRSDEPDENDHQWKGMIP